MIATHETHTLNVPISHQGRDYTELRVRRLTAKDLLRGSKMTSSSVLEGTVTMLVDLCEVERAVIESLDASDFIALQTILNAFQRPSEGELRRAIMVLSTYVSWDLATLANLPVEAIVAWLTTAKDMRRN